MGLGTIGSNPMFPNIIFNKYNYFINHYNLLNISKQHKIKIIFTKKIYNLVKIFYSLGLINNYYLYTSNSKVYIKLTLFFYKNTVFFKNIKIISSITKKHYITYKSLKLLNFYLKSSFLLISTPFGIITHNDALRKKVGGLLLFLIN